MMVNNKTDKNFISKIKKHLIFFVVVPLSIYFIFGLIHLTKFETADEHYWMYSNYNNNNYWENDNGRIHQYWEALLSGNWKKTRINDKPGITLAYVSGIGSYLKTNLEKNIVNGVVPAMSKSDKAQVVNLYFRLPLLIFNGLFSILLFYLIRKLFKSNWIALISTTFILLSPIIVGISQIVNPDALLWEFGFASLLSFLIYLQENKNKFAVLSSIFLGLALLTKYSSVIFLPFFLAVIFFYIIENIKSWSAKEIPLRIRKLALTYFLIVAGALVIYAVILPDNLVEFRHFMKGSIGFKGMQYFFLAIFSLNAIVLLDTFFSKSRISGWILRKLIIFQEYLKILILAILPIIFVVIIINTIFGFDWLKLFTIPFDSSSKTFFSKLSFEDYFQRIFIQFLPLIFSLSPLVFLAVLYAWIKNMKSNSQYRWIVFIFSFFIVIFVASSFQQKIILTNRYSILLYPFIFTIASIGIVQFFVLFKEKIIFKMTIFLGIIIISLFSLWRTKPFYFNYSNILLPQKYLISDAWGYGGYEAAQFLNSLPNADQMKIWADYNGTCLFFNGKCEANYLTMKNIQKKATNLPHFDYFVATRRGNILSKKIWSGLKEKYETREIWNLTINNHSQNFIMVYENEIYKK